MPEDIITSLIVVLATASTKDVENEGKIIAFGSGANLNTVRTLAAEKLGISSSVPLEDIILRAPSGRILEGINDIRDQQVIHVDLQEHIKEVIPGPQKLPFVGSLYSLMPDQTEGWLRMFRTYGPLVNMNLLGTEVISTWDPKIAEVFCKESEYFTKKVNLGLKEVKLFAGQGLFTTDTSDDDWKLAHKLLMPAFSPRAIKAYLHEMGVIAIETIKTLEQYKPDQRVEILDWTTKLTFETIGRTGFGYHFHLLGDINHTKPHPFIEAMGYCLRRTLIRSQQAEFYKRLPTEPNRHFEKSIKLMSGIVDDVIAERKKSPEATDKNKDLLGFMLNARDEHGLGLSDENIRYQVLTFLIAGHDTTANTLAWCLYELSRHPEIEQAMLQEIANVGITHTEIPTIEQIGQLKYMHQVIKETLRKYPPVRSLTKYCSKDCIVYGGYRVPENTVCQVSTYSMHHNPDVYTNPEVFDPERFTPEEEQKRSRFAWLPFSTGPRSCIGMAFALQEAKVVLSMFLHRFKFCYEGPDIGFNSTVATTKPEELFMTIHPRVDFPKPTKDGFTPPVPSSPKKTANVPNTESMAKHIASQKGESASKLPNATFLFGTQTGTSQDYAAQLASQARAFGFKNVKLLDMDDWEILQTGKYEPKKSEPDDLLVVVTATYNGQPPDHAEKFSKFITAKTEQPGNEKIMDKLNYAVFGVGNKNWRTYQAFPRKVSNGLSDLGANQFFPTGEGDVDQDADASFNEWSAHFWMQTLSYYGVSLPEDQSMVPTASVSVTVEKEPIHVNFISPNDQAKWKAGQSNRNGDYNAHILANRELQQPGSGRSTRHIELDISKLTPLCENGQLYTAGDHLEVFPENDSKTVQAVALNFGWVLDSVFEVDPESLKDVSPRSLAACIKGPCTVENALKYYADLTSPPSRVMLSIFAEQLSKASPETADTFRKLIMPDSAEYPEFIEKNRTLLELQKHYPQVNQLELGQFLSSIGVMQPRRYSIASSPLPYPDRAHLTVGVVHDVLKDGSEFYGLASSYLARTPAKNIHASLKSAKSTFYLPSDPSVPIIMIAAGTGLSPFRGFIQERAYLKEKENKDVGETVLFFGCRREDQDYIYSDELKDYVEKDVLTGLYVAFSRQGDPVKYVQHQLLANATEVFRLLDGSHGKKPASIYVCGAGTMSRDVRRTFCNMVKSFGTATTDEEADTYIQTLLDNGRYNEDVWG
ncbi:cytochrome P450 [Phascolomyces articulosus]|uniref:NADPH--hemoprotein reductase n=1 Tax=Phascolomyces articulosus TaxID=60185 RepID=A0AAD5JV37_9FUNG|nr:cytochrome P450 [Phascolomyces articulosus]